MTNRNNAYLRDISALTLLSIILATSASAIAQSPAQSQAPAASAGSSSVAMQPHNDAFVIGNDDILTINVWKEADVSRTLPVRSDGKISLPLAGELQASGQTPRQLEAAIADRLKSYIEQPEVTVIVTEIKSRKFNILGEVAKPGTYPLTNTLTVIDAVALAGGFKDFAKQKSIYVLRRDANGGETRIPVNYKDIIHGKHAEQNIALQSMDTVVVP